MLDKNFKDIISHIKEEIINTQIKTMQEVNTNNMEIILRSKCQQNLN